MTPKAERLLQRVAAWADGRDDIRLVMVLGSQARAEQPADEYSDLDLVLSSTEHRRYLDDAGWLAAFGMPLLTFREPTATGGEFERRVLFDSGLDADFTLMPHARLVAIAAGAMPGDIHDVLARGLHIAVDKDGLAPLLQQHAETPLPPWRPPAPAEFLERTDDFLYHCLWAVRKAARGELFLALQCLEGPLRRHLFDAILLHHRLSVGMTHAWYGARMIEDWADPRLIERLRTTCAQHERHSLDAAVAAAMDLDALLGGEIASHLGTFYPSAAAARVRELIAVLNSKPLP